MNMPRWFKLLLAFTSVISIAACGSNGSTNGSNSGFLMGGAVQGKTLSLTGSVTTWAGTSGTFGSADGIGGAASFQGPNGITTDGVNLYVTDTSNSTIRKIVIATGAVTTIAGTAGTWGSSDGTGGTASFMFPCGITTDATNLYVADTNNHTIRKIVLASGAVTTIAGTPGVFGSSDGNGTVAKFNWPKSITTDGINLYVADTGNSTIRKIAISSGTVTTLAGTPGVYGSTDGIGAAASFGGPYGIATDGTNLYVSDSNNHTIRKIVISSGAVSTFAGTSGVLGALDGIGTSATFNWPNSITTDGTYLYVTDTNNSTIRKIAISGGVVTTLAGTAGNFGSNDDSGTTASFNRPIGITTNGTDLYVSDTSNNSIRKIR